MPWIRFCTFRRETIDKSNIRKYAIRTLQVSVIFHFYRSYQHQVSGAIQSVTTRTKDSGFCLCCDCFYSVRILACTTEFLRPVKRSKFRGNMFGFILCEVIKIIKNIRYQCLPQFFLFVCLFVRRVTVAGVVQRSDAKNEGKIGDKL